MTLTHQLAGATETGVTNLTHSAGASWEALVTEWLVANVADGQGGSGVNSYVSYNVRGMATSADPSVPYPLAITPVSGATFIFRGNVSSGTGSYFMIKSGPNGASRTVRLLTNDGSAAANFPGARLVVVRLR